MFDCWDQLLADCLDPDAAKQRIANEPERQVFHFEINAQEEAALRLDEMIEAFKREHG